jgi:hypothetical protein
LNEQDLHFQRAALTEVATYRNARPSDRVVVNGGELAERLRQVARVVRQMVRAG